MEFPFDVDNVLPGIITVLETLDNNESAVRIYSLDSKFDEREDTNASWIYFSSANTPWDIKLKKRKEDLTIIVDEMGHASAKAQSLRSSITTLKKLLNSSHQKIYFIRDDNKNKTVIGFLKIGTKRLFVSDDVGAHHEVDPLCILDFYVHETKQRCGFGHKLFNVMLQTENVMPEKLAVDRPSFKFLSFLNKHYSLKNPISQSNNFVIFPGFFLNREITRPPIFLYSGKAMQPSKSNKSSPKLHSRPSSCSSEVAALNSIKVPLCSEELKKNKTFYSSAANCLMWNDDEKVTVRNRQLTARNYSAHSSNIKSSSNWHVHTGMQSSDVQDNDGWNSSHSTPCSLTPVNNVPNYSRRKCDLLQSSSWNIFGVKPVDYTLNQRQNKMHKY